MNEPPVCYRALDYYFEVACDAVDIREYIHHVLGAFETASDSAFLRTPPTPNLPPRYTFECEIDSDGTSRFDLLYGIGTLLHNVTAASAVDYFLWHVNNEAMRQSGSYFLIHAGVVATPAGDGVLLPATGGSGKSTLVAALVRNGYGYLSDEAAAIDPVTRAVFPFPKALTLKSGSFGAFPDLAPQASPLISDLWHVPAGTLRAGSQIGAVPIRWILFIRYRAGRTELSALARAAALAELWSHALSVAIYGGRTLSLLSDIVRGTRAYSLEFGSLDAAVATIGDLTAPSHAE